MESGRNRLQASLAAGLATAVATHFGTGLEPIAWLVSRTGFDGDIETWEKIADQLGVHPEALRVWVKQAETDAGQRPGTTIVNFPLDGLRPAVAARAETWERLGLEWRIRPAAANHGKPVVVSEFESVIWLGNVLTSCRVMAARSASARWSWRSAERVWRRGRPAAIYSGAPYCHARRRAIDVVPLGNNRAVAVEDEEHRGG